MRVGKITENALKRWVLKQIRTEYKGIESAAVGTDCAFSYEKKTFSAIYPVTENISDPGFFAVMKAANSLIAQGIKPDHVALSILLPADAEEKVLKKIVADALRACRMCGTVYSGGKGRVQHSGAGEAYAQRGQHGPSRGSREAGRSRRHCRNQYDQVHCRG